MQNGLFKLDWGSIADAVVMAMVFAVITALYGLVTQTGGFNVFTADWLQIGQNMTNAAFAAGVISLAKDLISTNSGSVLNITPAITQQ